MIKKTPHIRYTCFVFLTITLSLRSMDNIGVLPFHEALAAAQKKLSEQWEIDNSIKEKEIKVLQEGLAFQKEDYEHRIKILLEKAERQDEQCSQAINEKTELAKTNNILQQQLDSCRKAQSASLHTSPLKKAALIIPSSYDEPHLCIQTIKTALDGFKNKETDLAELITNSRLALTGAASFIRSLFNNISSIGNKDRLLEMLTNENNDLKKQLSEAAALIDNTKQNLIRNQEANSNTILQLQQQLQPANSQLEEATRNIATLTRQKDMYGIAFLLCALSFFIYSMRGKYA